MTHTPGSVRLYGAGGVIETTQVAIAHLRGLNEKTHPYVLPECPDLLSVGFRCRRAGYSFEWPSFSDHPILRAPDGMAVLMLNILDVPYYLEEIQESDATPSYHEYVRHMLSLAGSSAVVDESETANTATPLEPSYPMAPTIEQFLDEAGDRIQT